MESKCYQVHERGWRCSNIIAICTVGTTQHSTSHYSAVQYNTVRCSTVQYSTVLYSVTLCSTSVWIRQDNVTCSTAYHSTVHWSSLQYSTVHYSTVQCSTVSTGDFEVEPSRPLFTCIEIELHWSVWLRAGLCHRQFHLLCQCFSE